MSTVMSKIFGIKPEEIGECQRVLNVACHSGDIVAASKAIDDGADGNYQGDFEDQDVNQIIQCTANGNGTLWFLVEVNPLFQSLLDRYKILGTINYPSKYGKVLQIAYTAEGMDRVQCFARVREKDRTLLHDATINGHQDIVELLMDKGADPERKDYFGNTARDLAVSKGDKTMMNKLWPKWTREEGEHLKAVARMTEQPKLLEDLEKIEQERNSAKRVLQQVSTVYKIAESVRREPDRSVSQGNKMALIGAIRGLLVCKDEELKNLSTAKQDEIQPGLMAQEPEGLNLSD